MMLFILNQLVKRAFSADWIDPSVGLTGNSRQRR